MAVYHILCISVLYTVVSHGLCSSNCAFDQLVLDAILKGKHSFPINGVGIKKYPGLSPLIKQYGAPASIEVGKVSISQPIKVPLPELPGFTSLSQTNVGQGANYGIAQTVSDRISKLSGLQGLQSFSNIPGFSTIRQFGVPEIDGTKIQNIPFTSSYPFQQSNQQPFLNLPVPSCPTAKLAPFNPPIPAAPTESLRQFYDNQITNYNNDNSFLDPKNCQNSIQQLGIKSLPSDLNAAALQCINTKTFQPKFDFNAFLQSQNGQKNEQCQGLVPTGNVQQIQEPPREIFPPQVTQSNNPFDNPDSNKAFFESLRNIDQQQQQGQQQQLQQQQQQRQQQQQEQQQQRDQISSQFNNLRECDQQSLQNFNFAR